ncbi:hypothetical protein H632_c1752p0, partial [Helicosporidium sp. ATCC 50920]
MALFPLADRSTLNSVLLPGTRGRSKDLQVSQDPVFTSTVACDAAHRSAVVLDSVPYMSNGAFTINFWLKTHEPAGTEQQSPSSAKQVIFSHQNRPEGHAQAEEVSIALLPGGGINVTVADGNDSLQGMSRGQCLHINGTYVRTTSENDEVVPIDISDGEWHMLTLTTQPVVGTRGIVMYVDGCLGGDSKDSMEGKIFKP